MLKYSTKKLKFYIQTVHFYINDNTQNSSQLQLGCNCCGGGLA